MFCSHLAMRGASAVKIQKLAGHAKLSTTQIYMHLAPSSLDDAVSSISERVWGRSLVSLDRARLRGILRLDWNTGGTEERAHSSNNNPLDHR